MRRFVHEHHYVQRIAVFAQRRRDEAEVEGEHHAFRQQSAQLEKT